MLFTEIIAAYVPLLRRVRSNDLAEMVAAARAPSRRRASVPPIDHHETAVRLGGMVQGTLSVLPTDKRCLIRSLVTLRMLEHRSIEGRLIIGVLSDGSFGAHAWVEHAGEPVLPAGLFHRITEL